MSRLLFVVVVLGCGFPLRPHRPPFSSECTRMWRCSFSPRELAGARAVKNNASATAGNVMSDRIACMKIQAEHQFKCKGRSRGCWLWALINAECGNQYCGLPLTANYCFSSAVVDALSAHLWADIRMLYSFWGCKKRGWQICYCIALVTSVMAPHSKQLQEP